MLTCFFVTDLHGNLSRYSRLFKEIESQKPDIVLIGGDILPNPFRVNKTGQHIVIEDFIENYLLKKLRVLKDKLRDKYPEILVILGNDDVRTAENQIKAAETEGLWKYLHNRKTFLKGYDFYGYSYVPPTPFRLKDWEKYDVSRYVDPGCIHPAEGLKTVDIDNEDFQWDTIKKDLDKLVGENDLSKAIFLFHTPPYKTKLDRAALDGIKYDSVPLDVNVGSIAVKNLIDDKQPLITLHGHIHESSRITGEWKEVFGNTLSINAAFEGIELALVKIIIDKEIYTERFLLKE
ncbi:MAG: metallophosphoesterase [Bacteroidales bacterium]|nr:metallophosphoesterase [Bacteroidales bacterium]